MRHALFSLVTLLLLLTIAGCGTTPVADVTATPEPPPDPTLPPTDRPTPEPTATWVPTPTSPSPSPTPLSTPAPALPDDVLATMDAIEVEMEDLRGLEETTPLTRTLMTRQELADYLQRELEAEYPPEEIESDVRVLAAFDFVPEDFDLKRVILDLYSTQVLGLYDDEEDTFYIVTDDEFDLLDRLTFAHEYTHGLQDQHYGLDLFVDEDRLNDDQILARMSLVEGDATLAMTEYLYAHLSELSAQDLAELQGEEIEGSTEALAAAPPIIRETLDFPYVYGLEFVMTIQEEGWEAVDRAFADPPQSTEQILHPEKYLTRDEPQIVTLPPLTDTLGADWHLLEAESLGEFQTGLYLEQQVDEATADLASQGWDGDLYAVYVREDDEVLVFATVWDSATDRDEFVFAYTQYATAKYGQAASRTGDAEAWWETPSQAAALDWEGPAILIVVGPDLETVARVLDEIKLHEETA